MGGGVAPQEVQSCWTKQALPKAEEKMLTIPEMRGLQQQMGPRILLQVKRPWGQQLAWISWGL